MTTSPDTPQNDPLPTAQYIPTRSTLDFTDPALTHRSRLADLYTRLEVTYPQAYYLIANERVRQVEDLNYTVEDHDYEVYARNPFPLLRMGMAYEYNSSRRWLEAQQYMPRLPEAQRGTLDGFKPSPHQYLNLIRAGALYRAGLALSLYVEKRNHTTRLGVEAKLYERLEYCTRKLNDMAASAASLQSLQVPVPPKTDDDLVRRYNRQVSLYSTDSAAADAHRDAEGGKS